MGSGSNRRALKDGNFITLEGGEGSGKTTQTQLLHDSLISAGIETIITREPGGTPQSEEIRSLLVSGESKRWEPLTESLLHFASRNEHLVKVILPTLQAGKWVICDRFFDSTMAYQGYAMSVDRQKIGALAKMTMGKFAPDLTLILDIPESKGLVREEGLSSEDRYNKMGASFHKKVRMAFREIASQEPERCKIIDASKGIQEVHNSIWLQVKAKFNL